MRYATRLAAISAASAPSAANAVTAARPQPSPAESAQRAIGWLVTLGGLAVIAQHAAGLLR